MAHNEFTYVCKNPAYWHKYFTMHTKQNHHHPPLSWRRDIKDAHQRGEIGVPDESWWAEMDLCGYCHDEYHTLLNLYVHHDYLYKKIPPYELRKTYGIFIRNLVTEAWNNRPPGKVPYTLPNGLIAYPGMPFQLGRWQEWGKITAYLDLVGIPYTVTEP